MKHILLSVLVAFVVIGFGSAPITSHAATLQELKAEQQQAADQAEKYRKLQEQQQQSASNYAHQVEDTEKRIVSVGKTIEETAATITKKENEISQLEREIEVLKQRLAKLKGEQDDTIVQMYELKGTSTIEMIASSDPLSRNEDQNEYLSAIESHLNKLIDESIELKASQDSKKQQLDKDKTELLALKEDYQVQKTGLESEKAKKSYLQDQAENLAEKYDQVADEAEAKKQEFDQAIATALRNRSSVVKKGHVNKGQVIGYMGGKPGESGFSSGPHLHFSTLRNGDYVNPRGVVGKNGISWPFDSDSFYVSQPYGPANWKNSLYTQHNGIDMVANAGYGAPVFAAGNGEIIEPFPQYNGWMPGGYGHYVVIDHGNGIWSLYGHLIR